MYFLITVIAELIYSLNVVWHLKSEMTKNNLNITILGKKKAVEALFSLNVVLQTRFTSAISLTYVC